MSFENPLVTAVNLFSNNPTLFLVGAMVVGAGWIFYKIGFKVLAMIDNNLTVLVKKTDTLSESLQQINTSIQVLKEKVNNHISYEESYDSKFEKIEELSRKIAVLENVINNQQKVTDALSELVRQIEKDIHHD